MKRTFSGVVGLFLLVAGITSCGHSNPSSSQHRTSGLKFRAFVSNPLFSSGLGNAPVLNIVDATQDRPSSVSFVTLIGILAQPTLMAVSPSLRFTVVFSAAGNSVAVVDNSTENVAQASGASTSVPVISLPAFTESMFIASDNATAYFAMPSAPVLGQPPGAVAVENILNGSISATIPIPGAHYIVPSSDGTKVFVFSDNSNSVTVISTALVGTNQNPLTTISGFDRPVWGISSGDNTTLYVFNCGPECHGTQASISFLDIASSTISATTPLTGATTGLLSGTTLYVAGTPPGTPCGSGTAARACGTLNLLDVGSRTVINSSPILITDGFHNRMQLSQNGQLFIGAHSCSNVNISGGEVRGCLTIYDTSTQAVVIPPQLNDVTGMQAISGRNIVYVCQGGVFTIFNTLTDQLLIQNPPVDIVGQVSDVKLVDPPPN